MELPEKLSELDELLLCHRSKNQKELPDKLSEMDELVLF